jgi:NADH:ubiquinone oxidoreductase subunit K
MPIVMEVILPWMLLAVNLNFLLFSIYLDDMMGQLYVLFVLIVAATESIIGLALLVKLFRIHRTNAMEFSVGDTPNT